MAIDFAQDVGRVAEQLCGTSFVKRSKDGREQWGLITETAGYVIGGPKNREQLFRQPPGTIVLWQYRSGYLTNIAAHPYDGEGLVELRNVQWNGEDLGPLTFTERFGLKHLYDGRDSMVVRKTRGTGIYVAETKSVADALTARDVLNEEDHPGHRVAHYRLVHVGRK